MGKRTGKPRGRPPGSRNKKTDRHELAMQSAMAQVEPKIEGAFPGNAHAFLMLLYKNPCLPLAVRLEAAKVAIRYETPALSAIAYEAKEPFSEIEDPEELRRWLAEEAVSLGIFPAEVLDLYHEGARLPAGAPTGLGRRDRRLLP